MTISRFSALKRKIPLVVTSALVVLSMSSAAYAENPATKVSSSGTGLIVDLGVVAPLLGLNVTAAPVAGSATATTSTYGATGTLKGHLLNAGANVNLGGATGFTILGVSALNLSLGVTTGVIDTSAKGPFPSGTGTSTVNGLGIDSSLTALGINATLLGLDAKTLSSTTSFTGGPLGTLSGTSSITKLTLTTLISGLGLNASGLALNGNVAVTPGVDTTIIDVLGLKIIANEQILSDVLSPGNTHTATLTTNALDINFDKFLLGGQLLSGHIIVAQSSASFTRAVPEMSTWAMMIIGLGGLGGSLRSRNRAKTRVKFSTGFPALQTA